MNESEQLIVEIFTESARIHGDPPVYWKDPHGFQAWARAKSLFLIEGGIRLTPPDSSDAGRKQFSRLRQKLEADGTIWITRIGPTSQYAALTLSGLAMAEKLTGQWAPEYLRKATKAMAAEMEADQ